MGIAFIGLALLGQACFGDHHPLTGSYTERTDPSIRLSIDPDGYAVTNLIAQYGEYKLAHRFPHRLFLEEERYKTRGYMALRWTLEGQDWDCEYPVWFVADPGPEGHPIDVTITSPGNIYIPTTIGTCPYGAMTDWLLGFNKN